jgi:hypothetical protein
MAQSMLKFKEIPTGRARALRPGAGNRKNSIPSALTGAGVSTVIDFSKVLEVEVCVDLSGPDISVTQQVLHGAQIAARFEQVAGKRVTQHVRVDVTVHALATRPVPKPLLHGPPAQAAAAASDEKGAVSLRIQCGSLLYPAPQCQPRVSAYGQNTGFASLARDFNGAL